MFCFQLRKRKVDDSSAAGAANAGDQKKNKRAVAHPNDSETTVNKHSDRQAGQSDTGHTDDDVAGEVRFVGKGVGKRPTVPW